MLEPLNLQQKAEVHSAFGAKRLERSQADKLIRDWRRVAEVAHHVALTDDVRQTTASILTSPRVKARRDTQLKRGIAAIDSAVESFAEIASAVSKHPGIGVDHSQFQRWAETTTVWLAQIKANLDAYRQHAGQWPRHKIGRGKRRWLVEDRLIKVLAAYFRVQGWDVARSQGGLFAQVSFAVLPNWRRSSEITPSINHRRLQMAAASTLDFSVLETQAPRDVEFAYPDWHRAKLRAANVKRNRRRSSAL